MGERRPLLQAALLDTAIPLKFINGNVAPNSGSHMMNALQAIKPDADIAHLEKIGHWPKIEQPEHTVREVRMFHGRIAFVQTTTDRTEKPAARA